MFNNRAWNLFASLYRDPLASTSTLKKSFTIKQQLNSG